jgi:predicted deacylase
MKEAVRIAGIEAQPGTIVKGWWEMAELYDNSKVEIPIAIVNGADDGPKVWMQCSVHGDEYVGVVAIQEILRSIDPNHVSGLIVALPWVNVLAFRAGERMAPQDGMDMNRVFPGKSMEDAMHIFAHTELVVDRLFAEIKDFHAVLDLHDGGWMGCMSPYTQYFSVGQEVDERSRKMAIASGMDIVWESPPGFVEKKAPGSVGTVTTPMGIPTMTIEIGGEGRVKPEDIGRMKASVENILKFLHVIPGEPARHGREEPQFVRQGHWLRPRRGGIYLPKATAGEMVKKGDLVGEIRDPFGETIETILAPHDGVVIGMRTYGTIATGQYAGNVAKVVDTLE